MSSRQETTNTLLDELDRTGQLTSQAHTYIDEAIDHYSRNAFWFNEEIATAQTVTGEEYLDLPANWGLEYTINVQIGTNTYPLNERTFAQMDDLYISAANYTGYPEDYCIYREQIRLGPIPSGAYTLKMAYLKQPNDLTSDSATNISLENINELVRMRAARRMCERILQDTDRAQYFLRDEMEALRMARSKSSRYQMTGHSRKRGRRHG